MKQTKFVSKIKTRIVNGRPFGETSLPYELYKKFLSYGRTHLHWEYDENSDTIAMKPI